MDILDDIKKIKKLDKSNLLGSVQQLWLQLKQTKEELRNLSIPKGYEDIKIVVVNGMGGSRLGGRVAARLFEDTIRVPIIPIGSYALPSFVDNKTLLILSSYSGDTEEVLFSAEEAFKRKAKILVFAQSGDLTKIAQEKNLPGYYGFLPKYNPCNKPRMSLGYQLLGIILLLSKCGLLKISSREVDNLIMFIKRLRLKWDVSVPTKENLAKKIAKKIQERIPVFIAAEFLMGAVHVWRNQTNENAKQLAVYFEIPELNHHLLEGLGFPQNNPKSLLFLIIKSDIYHPRNQKRVKITEKVLDGYKIKHMDIKLSGETRLMQVFELIQLGSYVGFYLSMLNNLDPSPIPWVDYFKKKLAEAVE